MNFNPSYELATPSLSSYKTLLLLFQRWLQKKPFTSTPVGLFQTSDILLHHLHISCSAKSAWSLVTPFFHVAFTCIRFPVFGLTEWVQSLYRLSRRMPDRPTSKNRPIKKQKNKNSLKVHRMGRANFKPHQSLCDVWVIWCILAHHLKASSFSLVVGSRGSEIFGEEHRQ